MDDKTREEKKEVLKKQLEESLKKEPDAPDLNHSKSQEEARQILQPYYNIVENALKRMEINPEESRGEDAGQWNLRNGNATVWVDVWYLAEEKMPYFQVIAPIMTTPDKKLEEFYAEILKINYTLFEVAFSLLEDGVYLKNVKEAFDLTEEQVIFSINRCGFYADYYNDKLIKRFGGKRIE